MGKTASEYQGNGEAQGWSGAAVAPGKRTLTGRMAPGRGGAGVAPPAAIGGEVSQGEHDDPFGLHLRDGGGEGGEGMINPDGPEPRPAPADNPLRGLVGGDGIVRPERGPRVVQLQEKLAAQVGPPGEKEKPWTSGHLDIPTLLRLHVFQRGLGQTPKNWIADDEADALWAGNGPKKAEKPDVPDKPDKPSKPDVPNKPDLPDEPDAPAFLDNPPEGLTLGDGTNAKTAHRKPYVRRLQTLLGEKMGAELVCSGEFDGETCGLLNGFQAKNKKPVQNTVDKDVALLLTGGTAKKFPLVNPALEDLLDATWLQHQMTLQRSGIALNQLAIDLAKPTEHPKKLWKSVLELAVLSAMKALPVLAAEAVAHALHAELVKELVEAPLEVLAEDKEKKIEHAFAHWQEPKAPPEAAPDFVEAQRRKLTDDRHLAQETFLLEAKGAAREFPGPAAKPPKDPDEDPRLEPAREALVTARNVSVAAEAAQYVRSLSAWSEALARTDLGSLDPKDEQRGVNMVDQDKVDDARGVLELHASGSEGVPEKPVRTPYKATLTGIPGAAVAHLKGQTIGTLQLPVSAQIHLLDELIVTVGKSGTTVWNGANKHELVFRGRKYLSYKGHGFGADVTKENAAAGAQKLMIEELGRMTLGEIALEHDD